MNNRRIARELLVIARELMAIDFPSQEAFDAYMKEHPEGDRSNHRVVKTETVQPTKTSPVQPQKKPSLWDKLTHKKEAPVQDVGEASAAFNVIDGFELTKMAIPVQLKGPQQVDNEDISKWAKANWDKIVSKAKGKAPSSAYVSHDKMKWEHVRGVRWEQNGNAGTLTVVGFQ